MLLVAASLSPLAMVVPLIAYALWVGRKGSRKGLMASLLVVLLLGAADVAVNGYFYNSHDCGVSYNPDLGCTPVLPNWLVPFGFAMLAVAVGLSLTLVIGDLNRRRPLP